MLAVALASSLWFQPEYRPPGTIIACDFQDPGCSATSPLGPVVDLADHPELSVADIRRVRRNGHRREAAESLWHMAQTAGDRSDVPQLVAPVEVIADAVAIDLVMIGVGTGADFVMTDLCLNKGGRELNPLGQRSDGRIGLKIGAAFLRGGVAYALRRTGHKGTANVFRWLGAAWDGGVTVHNAQCAFGGSK